MQVLYLGRAPRTKETLPDFREECRVTRHSRVFRRLTGSQRTPGFWGVTGAPHGEVLGLSSCNSTGAILCGVIEMGDVPACKSIPKSTSLCGGSPGSSSGKKNPHTHKLLEVDLILVSPRPLG